MNKLFWILMAGVVIMGLMAVGINANVDTQDQKSNTMPLVGTPWKWVSATENNTTIAPNDKDAFIITFNIEGSFSTSTDCNNMGGPYTINGTNMTIGEMFSTMMYCEDSQEAEYARLLKLTTHFDINGSTLTLGLSDTSGSMVFEATNGQ